jgi:hypothetical protein
MAKDIYLKHSTGLTKIGYYGFSWTTFFFGPFPALFRGDFKWFLIGLLAVLIITPVVGPLVPLIWVIWAFFYNRIYTRDLIQSGFMLDPEDDPIRLQEAKAALDVI